MSPQELALRMLEFQDLYGTREHLKDKYIRKKWRKSIAPRKALDLSNSDGNFDVMFVKSPPRRNKEYPVEKFDSFGFSDKFSRMYIQHTTPQLVADKPLEAVSYSFDSFVPKIDKELREERQRTKALAKAAQEVDPFPVTQSVFPVTPQTSSVFLDAANDSDWHPDFFNRDLLSASPHVISQAFAFQQLWVTSE
ncbi:hypothetical protein L0F63_002829 [Massospora cicadina]|nr:hypothetical protein L0F63_002829 [Massospora cicadina]